MTFAPKPNAQDETVASLGASSKRQRRYSVLLVDDSRTDLAAMREYVEFGLDAQVHCAISASAAHRLLQVTPVDVALIDLFLGNDNGIEVIAKWRSEGVSIPLILLTSCESRDFRDQATNAGATLFLTKGSFTPIELRNTLTTCIEKTSHRGVA